jgi:DNA polymerase III epsilon subunit-like protein
MALKQVYIDIETTGLTNNNAIIQIAGIVVTGGSIKRRFVINMKPDHGQKIKVNKDFHVINKSKNVLTQKEGFAKFCKELELFVDKYNPKDKFQLIAYNAEFEQDKLFNFFKYHNCNFYGSYFHRPALCLMQKSAWVLQDKRAKLENFQQSTVAKELKIKVIEERLHVADYDIELSYEVNKKLDEFVKNKILNEN